MDRGSWWATVHGVTESTRAHVKPIHLAVRPKLTRKCKAAVVQQTFQKIKIKQNKSSTVA